VYCCTVSIESLTGNQDEDLMAFSDSAEGARAEVERLLETQYGCSRATIAQLMAAAREEVLAPWCAPPPE
jgi:hypothetical protein